MPIIRSSARDIREDPRCGALARLGAVLSLLALVLVSGAAATARAEAGTFSWTAVAEETIAALDEAAQYHAAGDITQCKRAITRAYFGVFEDRKMEAALRKMMGQSHIFMVERQFSTLRRTAPTASPAEFGDVVASLSEQLRADARQLDALGVPQEVYDVQ